LTANGGNGSGASARSGTRALALLADPLNGTILRALEAGPMRLVDLRRECGSPAQTTLRAHLRELEALGAIAKRRRDRFPGALEYELELGGRDLLFVLAALEGWLRQAPEKPLSYGSSDAKASIKALIEGWSSTMLRALAAGPQSLTELDRLISALNYPALERRLAALRLTGQVEACQTTGNPTPYEVTDWVRRGIAPLAAAARWERRHMPTASAPLGRIDTEAAFLLGLPLLRLDPQLSGSCRLGVEMRNGKKHGLVGATAYVDRGKASAIARLESDVDAWATGPAGAWLRALVGADMDQLELGGDQRLAGTLIQGLHRVLFKSKAAGVVA
jgi:DNA-binding HxlR family transcriptional regulator